MRSAASSQKQCADHQSKRDRIHFYLKHRISRIVSIEQPAHAKLVAVVRSSVPRVRVGSDAVWSSAFTPSGRMGAFARDLLAVLVQ
jgi:hypothetical protein